MKIITSLILASLVLAGCATDPNTTKMVLQAQREAHARPTIAMTCPAGGCTLTYHDPRDQTNFKLPTNGWDAAISLSTNLTGIAQGLVIPAAMGYVATQGFKALKGSGAVTTTNTTTTNTSNPVTTTTGPSNSGNTTTTPTTTTTTNTTTGPSNSGNTTTTPTTTTNTTTGPSNSGNTTTTPTTTTNTTTGPSNSGNTTTTPTTTTTTTTSGTTTPPAP